MARGVNKVILVGNIGKDPDVRFMSNGAAVANISIATSESWKDKQTGEMQERTEWHNVVFFNRLAEIVGEFLKKGSQVYVEGSLRTRKYTDKNGIDRYATEVVASEMQMLGGRQGMGGNDASASRYQEPMQNAQPSSNSSTNNASTMSDGFDQYDDDDIPF